MIFVYIAFSAVAIYMVGTALIRYAYVRKFQVHLDMLAYNKTGDDNGKKAQGR